MGYLSAAAAATSSDLSLADLILRSYDNVPASKLAAASLAESLVQTLERDLLGTFEALSDLVSAAATQQQRRRSAAAAAAEYQDKIANQIRALLSLTSSSDPSNTSRSKLIPLLETPILSMDSRLNLMICLTMECKFTLGPETFGDVVSLFKNCRLFSSHVLIVNTFFLQMCRAISKKSFAGAPESLHWMNRIFSEEANLLCLCQSLLIKVDDQSLTSTNEAGTILSVTFDILKEITYG